MAKMLFALLALLASSSTLATDYYISTSGDDTNNGTSKSTPWKNAPGMPDCSDNCDITPQPGDRFLFKGGDTWAMGDTAIGLDYDGSAGNPIIWDGDEWGTSADAKFTVSANRDSGSRSVIQIAASTYLTVQDFEIDVQQHRCRGVVIGNDTGNVHGPIKMDGTEGNIALKNLLVEGCGVPGDTDIVDCVMVAAALDVDFPGPFLLDGITTVGSSNAGITVYTKNGRSTDNVTIRNCDVSNYAYGDNSSNIGLQLKNATDNVLVEYCTVHDGDSEISHAIVAGGDPGHAPTNVTIRNNVIYRASNSGIFLFYGGGDWNIYDNIVYNVGANGVRVDSAWTGDRLNLYNNTLVDSYDDAIYFSTGISGSPTINVKNNLCYKDCSGNDKRCMSTGSLSITHSNNNFYCYDSASTHVVDRWDRSEWVSSWNDTGGQSGDPMLGNRSNPPTAINSSSGPNTRGFTLQSGSPAVDQGADLGPSYDKSVNLVTRPSGAGWDVGAYESAVPENVQVYIRGN
jgi:hypothetical protein